MSVVDRELEDHRRSFSTFRHMVVFAALHIALTLACLALAFVGNAQLTGFLIWLAGTLVLAVAVMVHGSGRSRPGL